MPRIERAAPAAIVLLGALWLAPTTSAVEPKVSTEQAASSTEGDSHPGVTQLNQGADCSTVGSTTEADKGSNQGKMQASPSPCPADEAKGKPKQ